MENLAIAISSSSSKTHEFVQAHLKGLKGFKLFHYTDEEDMISKLYHETDLIIVELDFNKMKSSESELGKLALLKSRFPSLPIIVLSRGSFLLYAKELQLLGADSIIDLLSDQAGVQIRKAINEAEKYEDEKIFLSFIDRWEKKEFWKVYSIIWAVMAANLLLFLT